MTAAVILLAAAGFFRVERGDAGRWAFVRPDGQPTFVRSCNTVNVAGPWCATLKCHPYRQAVDRLFPSEEAWAAHAADCLVKWGFNCIGGNSNTSVWHRAGLFHERILHLGREFAKRDGGRHALIPDFPDVFSPAFADWIARETAARCAPMRDDPDLVGYELDNELPWKGLAALRPDDPGFTRKVAERYFSVYAAAIRKADPNHLLLGCRFAGMSGAPREVYEACGRHCEVVSFNNYPFADVDGNSVSIYTGQDVLDAQAAFARASAWAGGRPVFVTEWSFEALDSGLSNSHGGGTRYFTQTDRVRAAELYAKCMMASPHVVGYSFFKWTDQPEEGYFEDINCGLFTIDAKPYTLLTEMFARVQGETARWRRSPPPARATPPPAEPVTLRRHLAVHPPVAGAFAFRRDGKAFAVSNDAGLCLEGIVGRCETNALFDVSWGGASAARIDFMLCHEVEKGKRNWQLAKTVQDVVWREKDGMGVLRMKISDAAWGWAYEAVCDAYVYPGCGRFLVDVASVKNVGKKPIAGDRIFVRTLPRFVPVARKSPIALYRPLPDREWTSSGGLRFAVHAPTRTLAKNEFPADGKSPRLGESAFRPSSGFSLEPGDEARFEGTVWMEFDLR